jgi:hypothetical protein
LSDRRRCAIAAGRGGSAAGAAPRAGKALPAHTLSMPRRVRMRLADTCQAHRCAGGHQIDADHSDGTRRAKAGSPGALSGCAVWRRAPHRAGRRVSPPCRGQPGAHLNNTAFWLLPCLRQPTPPAAHTSFAATSDSRDTRSCKARPERDCRVGLGTQRGSQKTRRRAQIFHATSAGARTRCALQVAQRGDLTK